MAFDQTNQDIDTLTTLANAVVGACQDATAAAKDANAQLAAGDSDISGKLQSIISILQPFALATAPASDGTAAADPNAPTS